MPRRVGEPPLPRRDHETPHRGSRAQNLSDLHILLDACAASYLTNLGFLDSRRRDDLSDAVDGIQRLLLPGYAPLNSHLAAWLRFALLLRYAAYAVDAADIADIAVGHDQGLVSISG